MWGTWAWKLAPHVTALHNAQSVAGMLAIVAVSLLWPVVHPTSFRRRRTPALAALRLFLLCLPYNFSRRVLDLALPQQLDSGRLAPLVNLSHLVSASHLDFLLFTGLGWRLPLRPHMALQAVKLLILARFGVHAHCRGTLLSSPEVQQLASKTHSVLGFAAGVLAQGAATMLLEPREPYVQVAALLLLGWVLLGWVAPTLLLLPPPAPPAVEPAPLASTAALAAAQPRSSGSSGSSRTLPSGSSQPCADRGAEAAAKPVRSLLAAANAAAERAAIMLEVHLRALSWSHQRQQPLLLEPALPVPVAWLGAVSCAWICCCAVAQLYAS